VFDHFWAMSVKLKWNITRPAVCIDTSNIITAFNVVYTLYIIIGHASPGQNV